MPNYGGEKYIYFETKEVREDTGVVEEAKEKDPIFDDGNIPEDEESSDDSSDSDDDD